MTAHFLHRCAERGPEGVDPATVLADLTTSIRAGGGECGCVERSERLFPVPDRANRSVWRFFVAGQRYYAVQSELSGNIVTLLTQEMMRTLRAVRRGESKSLRDAVASEMFRQNYTIGERREHKRRRKRT